MLKSLSIKNYALIDELTAEFSSGLVIITGETGAGKSIIIDALSLILGDRASTEVVRSGSEKAIVEGVFEVRGNRKLASLLVAGDIESSDELVVRREISIKGQSRCFANDSPVTLAVLKQIGELLVDLHGQHEHQSLLRVETHGDLLDEFGGLDSLVQEFQRELEILLVRASELQELQQRENSLREKRELYEFQMQEIDAVAPVQGEEDALENELRLLENAEKLFGSTARLYETLYEGEHSIRDVLVIARNQLHDLALIDRQFEEAARECSSAEAIVNELARFVQSYNARVEFNPQRLEHIRERLGRLTLLKKKYGGSLDAVVSHREKIGSEVALAGNFEGVMSTLAGEAEKQRSTCAGIARRLTAKRLEVAKKLEKAVIVELEKLGIPNGRFAVRIAQSESSDATPDGGSGDFVTIGKKRVRLNPRGCDVVEFHVSTNLGEEAKPLVKVASGGEVSRIMLALKSILARSDRLPVLIFDEIDVGVSGRMAQAVGMSLKSLSAFHQVIAITHLPQIAGLADTHFAVVKEENGSRTRTTMRQLSLNERVHEVAKLMSGTEVTEAGLKGARELMNARKVPG